MSPRHLALRALLLICLTAASAPAADHPALSAFGLTSADVPGVFYLVRAADPLLPVPGLTVHARRGSTWVVSGSPAAIAALARQRCQLRRVDTREIAGVASSATRDVARPTAADPLLQALADSVTWAKQSARIAKLSSFTTRHSYSPLCAAAAETLRAFFQRLGLTAEFHEFTYGARTLRNVVATQLGVSRPDSIVVIGAHYDDMPSSGAAPGADDNASGMAAVMTAAELLSRYRFAYTIKYLAFGGEEQGTIGSERWAAWAAAQGLQIAAMLNYDMIGWWTAGVENDLEVEVGTTMTWLADVITGAAALYTTQACHVHVDDGAWWGDHYAFWQHGYPAANNEEAWDWGDPDFNPNYHTSGDVLAGLSPAYTVGCTQVAVTSLATLARRDRLTGVDDAPPARPVALAAWPNPFNPRVTLAFTLAQDDNARLAVYDLAGRRLAVLAARDFAAGRHSAVWDGRDARGSLMPSGVYVARVETPHGSAARRLVLAR